MIMGTDWSLRPEMLQPYATPECGDKLREDTAQGPDRLLRQRLKLVEDLWKSVLCSECPPEQVERLLRLKQLVC